MNYRNPSLQKLQSEYEQQHERFQSLKNEWNMPIRNFYKKNMGVGLMEGTSRNQIQIKIEAAPHQGFIDLIENNYPDLNFEEMFRLTQFVQNAELALPYFEEKKANVNLQMSIEYAKYRLKEFDILKLTKSIFPFLKPQNEDIFGSYFPKDRKIEIYVFPIKLFCILHGLDDKTLFVIVLAHELAHGYNHIGLDKDNRMWDSFGKTDHFVAEGLAQYYTSQFIYQYLHRNFKLIEVFETLLEFQPEPYQIFKKWDLSLEQMYGAFIDARRNNITVYEQFEPIMTDSKQRIRF